MVSNEQDDPIIGSEIKSIGSRSAITAEAAGSRAGEGGIVESLSLTLEDLLPDAAGEIVLFAGGDVAVNLTSHSALRASGVAEAHVTAAGVDVTGLQFYSFEGGVTLYSPHDILISPEV